MALRKGRCATVEAAQVVHGGELRLHVANGIAQFFKALGRLVHALLQLLGALLQLSGRFGVDLTARTQIQRTITQPFHTSAQLREPVLGARGLRQHQGPAALIELLIDLLGQLSVKLTRQAGALVAVTGRCEYRQFSRAGGSAWQRVGAEIGRNDECKRQMPSAHLIACGGFVGQLNKSKLLALFQLGHHIAPHIEHVVAVGHVLVQIHQAHRQRARIGGRVPHAGEVQNSKERRN